MKPSAFLLNSKYNGFQVTNPAFAVQLYEHSIYTKVTKTMLLTSTIAYHRMQDFKHRYSLGF